MGPPYVANPAFCKLLSPTGNYAPARAVSGPFQALCWHMHIGGNQKDVPGTQNAGLAMTLVPKLAMEATTTVTKRNADLIV